MADLVADDVTLTIQTATPHNPRIVGTKRLCRVKIAFGDGVLTYPALGVPMPTYEKFGLIRNLETLIFDDLNDASALMPKYDAENNKLRLYNPGAELTGGVDAPPAQVYYATAQGW